MLWHIPGVANRGQPAVDENNVYFSAAPDSHAVHAFDLATGALRWTGVTGGAGPGTSSQAGCQLANALVVCGDGSAVVALARSDGQLIWRYQPPTSGTAGIFPETIDSSKTTVYAPGGGGTVHALDLATGIPRWTATVQPAANVVLYRVADGGDVVFAPFTNFASPISGGVVAIGAADGSTRWIATFPHTDVNDGAKDIALWGQCVIVSLEDGRILGLDRATGQQLWTIPPIGYASPGVPFTGPVVSDDRTLVVVGSTLAALSLSSGWLMTFDLNSRTELGRGWAPYGSAADWRAVSDGAIVYFVSTTSMLFSFPINKPAAAARISPIIGFGTRPTLTSDKLFVGATDGYYALKR